MNLDSNSNIVEACCWDISLGVVGTRFGRYLLQCTSGNQESPEAVDHVGIKVFGNLYEYGDDGVLITKIKIKPGKALKIKSKYPVTKLRCVENIGTTNVTQAEFEQWIVANDDSKFAGSSYNVVTNSCVTWGIAACEFLGVEHPSNWLKIIAWAENNNRVAQLVGRSGMGSRFASNAVQKKSPKSISSTTQS